MKIEATRIKGRMAGRAATAAMTAIATVAARAAVGLTEAAATMIKAPIAPMATHTRSEIVWSGRAIRGSIFVALTGKS
jgi:hypothetical protein